MTPRDLAYWLQGYFEIQALLGEDPALTEQQYQVIKNHIALVRSNHPSHFFVEMVQFAVDSRNLKLISVTVSNYFQHVLDKLDQNPDEAQALHDGLYEANTLQLKKPRC